MCKIGDIIMSTLDVINDDGCPVMFYHGTTASFNEFDVSKSNPEANLGMGVYFSNSIDDVNHNYANQDGADLKTKMELEFEQFDFEYNNSFNLSEDADEEEIRAAIHSKYVKHSGFVFPVYLNMKNPIIFSDDAESETSLKLHLDEYGEIDFEQENPFYDFMEELQSYSYGNQYINKSIQELSGELYSISIGNNNVPVSSILSCFKNCEALYDIFEDGIQKSPETIFSDIMCSIGFDGILDYTVHRRFGENRDDGGQGMLYVNEETIHAVVFNPEQIVFALEQ
jgi:hypothetical protein